MTDHFGEWIAGVAAALLFLALVLVWPLGSTQILLIVVYLFATPIIGGLLYIRARRHWRD